MYYILAIMGNEPYKLLLNQLCEKTEEIEITDTDKLVIFSDLHMGNRRSGDDFFNNSALFKKALQDYYLKKEYTLILNGDIEELHQYPLHLIRKRWDDVYKIFDSFYETGRLYKIFGNHDSKLFSFPDIPLRYPLHEALRLRYKNEAIFLFHGHQLSFFYQKFNDLMGLILRYFARPLRIKSYSVAHDKLKKYKIEKRLYEFSKEKQIVSIIGHTHRPLFESMSKIDTLNYQIETLLRKFQKTKIQDREEIEIEIRELKAEIDRQEEKKGQELSLSHVYSASTIVPCVFNSGCVIGKRGITAIEILKGKIMLVHWVNKNVDKRYIRDDAKNTIRLDGTDYYRTVLKKDDLDYIFSRIRLLS